MGEATLTTGLLGSGKSIPSCRSRQPEMTNSGLTAADGQITASMLEGSQCVAHVLVVEAWVTRCCTGTRPQYPNSPLYTIAPDNTSEVLCTAKKTKIEETTFKVEESPKKAGSRDKCDVHLLCSLGGQQQCAVTVCVPVTDLDTTSPDELMSVPDLESIGEASWITKQSVDEYTITTTAIYETVPVKEAVDWATPTVDGTTQE